MREVFYFIHFDFAPSIRSTHEQISGFNEPYSFVEMNANTLCIVEEGFNTVWVTGLMDYCRRRT